MPKKPARPKRTHRISDEGRERRGDYREDREEQTPPEPKRKPITVPKLPRFMRDEE